MQYTQLESERFRVRIPVSAKDFSLLPNVQIGYGALPASYSIGMAVLFCG
jgi:hypothetical protein